jgi:amino acid efflux transporter
VPANSPNENLNGLTRAQAIPLAIGSVAGSGILFLPSAVYSEASNNSLPTWIVSVMLCVPMLLMFEDMVKAYPTGDGIESFVRLGLGDTVARCIPVLFVAVVIVGLPAGSLVAGRYLGEATGWPAAVPVAASAVMTLALVVNVLGSRASRRVQLFGTCSLLAMAILLILSALPRADQGVMVLIPDGKAFSVVLPASVLAFWAFAGFENLTLLSREFRHPDLDFLPVSTMALGTYGFITILLTISIAIRVPYEDVHVVTGLLQLADDIRPRGPITAAVATIAFAAMVLNSVAWMWGVSQLIARASTRSMFPKSLGTVGPRGVPTRALVLLAVLFFMSLSVLTAFPSVLVDAIAATSSVFVLIYLLTITSYLRVRGLTWRSGLNLVLLAVIVTSLVQSGWRSAYGIAVLLSALGAQLVCRYRRPREASSALRGARRAR